MAEKKGIPAWVWIGCGCLLFPALVALVLGAFGFFAFNYGKNAIESMADPEKRTAAALEKLGTGALPAGWHARTYFAIPFGFSLVVLGDGTPPPAPEGDRFEDKMRGFENLDIGNLGDNRRIFLYLKLEKSNDDTIAEILNGKQRGKGMDLDLGVKIEADRELSRGDLEVKGQRVAFVGKAGKLDNGDAALEIVYAELSFDCPDKGRRLGLIFDIQPIEGSFAGSVADGAVLQSFLDHFEVCH